MKFQKYNSIENAYQVKYIDKIRSSLTTDIEWVATEKVHGANFSFHTDGLTVNIAKRTSFITGKEIDTFYNCRNVIDSYRDRILKLFALLDAKVVIIYGELFGGHYPGIKSKATSVQKGVYYHPEQDFYAFDIVADGKTLNYDLAVKLFESVNLIYAKILYRGSLKDVLKWSDEHKSDITTIPSYYGLPSIPDNKREGHVLKPSEAQYLGNSLIMLKDKNPHFSEKQKVSVKISQADDPELQKVIEQAIEYVNSRRYDNIVSKIGIVSKKDVGRLIGLLSKDALEDYSKDNDIFLEKENITKLHKAVNNAARSIVLKQLV